MSTHEHRADEPAAAAPAAEVPATDMPAMDAQALPPLPPPQPPMLGPPVPQLLIEPQGWRVPAPPTLSLLEAAQASGVHLLRSCRNGTCRRCLCKLSAGSVHYRIDWPGLSADEKAEGWTLPCVAIANGDVAIEAPLAIRTDA